MSNKIALIDFQENQFSTTLQVAEPEDQQALDRDALAALGNTQDEGEPDLIVELIDLYLQNAPIWLEQIKSAVANRDESLMRRAAHTLKGSSGSIGVRRVAEICRLIERLDIMNSPTKLPALVQLLELHFFAASRALLAEHQRRIV